MALLKSMILSFSSDACITSDLARITPGKQRKGMGRRDGAQEAGRGREEINHDRRDCARIRGGKGGRRSARRFRRQLGPLSLAGRGGLILSGVVLDDTK